VVSFGAWAIGGWMWGGTDDDDAIRAIQAGIDHGITCIDTAPTYGMGHSEKVVGEAIRGKHDQVIIATKCGIRWDLEEGHPFFETKDNEGVPRTLYRNLRPHSIRTECENSLRRMRIEHIDLYQCHWPDPTTPLEETMSALLELKKEGKIRAIGVSNFTTEMMDECRACGPLDSDQPKYSALVRDIEADVLPYCKKHTIGVLAYSPIAQGLLTGKVDADREFPEGDLRRTATLFSRENRVKINAMLKEVFHLADAHGATLAQLFIAWLNAQPGMTSSLVGARNAQQAIENAKAGTITLAPDEIQHIRDAVESLGALG
jgi:aryl-alcohol dehydrogenase-like predicted oxidoreductase